MDVLMVSPISKASAIQRAGRAGRTSPGKCFRLYTKDDYQALMDQTEPEICRTELTTVILQLKALGINNVVKGFEFLDPPNSIMVERALEFLYALGAISEAGHLTDELGLKMAEMPVDPMMAKIVSLCLVKKLFAKCFGKAQATLLTKFPGKKNNFCF
ncbi:P-loop containing nucleoside triphosphate hydrolase protein [Phakopsora pachyrhizi]|nr:P-loop containing nucleoside triphosphate hydrolase protein [Phakopsora pachyrhizi]